MNGERVSARPANLEKFVAASRQINDEIKAKVAAVQTGYDPVGNLAAFTDR